jgi:hypothetical protein
MLETYEVKRRIEFGADRYIYYPVYKGSAGVKGASVRDFVVKMFHIEAPNQEKAVEKSERYGGRFISCCKVNMDELVGNSIENIPLNPPPDDMYGKGTPYKSPIAMDNMIWQKRNLRRNNLQKDKEKD